jgi:acyl carrier protein
MASTQTAAEAELAELIIAAVNLEGVAPADVDPEAPLFGAGLGLDSIDALELVVKLEKEFGIKIGSSEESRQALASVGALAAYIRARQSAPAA